MMKIIKKLTKNFILCVSKITLGLKPFKENMEERV
jgi:hypothetical protein